MGFLYQNTSANNQCIGIGDSLCGGNNAGTPISSLVTLPNFQGVGWDRHSACTAGITSATQLRDPNSMNGIVDKALQYVSPNAPVNLAVIWCISNNFAGGQTLSDGLTDYKNLCLELKRWGMKVLLMGFISREGVADSYVSGMHGALMTTSDPLWFGNYADAYWNPAYMAPFGQNISGSYPSGAGARNGTYYDTGGVHLKTAGFTKIISGGAGYDMNSAAAALINNSSASLSYAGLVGGCSASKYPLLNQKDAFDIATSGL